MAGVMQSAWKIDYAVDGIWNSYTIHTSPALSPASTMMIAKLKLGSTRSVAESSRQTERDHRSKHIKQTSIARTDIHGNHEKSPVRVVGVAKYGRWQRR